MDLFKREGRSEKLCHFQCVLCRPQINDDIDKHNKV